MARRKAFEGRRMCLRKAPKDHTLLGLCIMYCGTGYRGLQLQTHTLTQHTVEGVLIQAMKDVGLVEALERGRVSGETHHFARSCRTDRGVHAVRNLICLFVPNERFEAVGGCEQLMQRLNAVLPLTVRVAHVTHLMGNFIPRFCCNRRVYRYLIPTYALIPPCDTWESFYEKFPLAKDSLCRYAQEQRSFVDLCPNETEPWLAAVAAAVMRGNEVLQRYIVGTHRFHNFSVDMMQRGGSGWSRKVIAPSSNEAVRTVHRCEIAPRVFLLPQSATGPTRAEYYDSLSVASGQSSAAAAVASSEAEQNAVDGSSDGGLLPFVVFQIEGSSFLFNMIRKIVGTVLATVRGARESLIEEALSPERRVTCPLAPGPYLYLFLSSYHGYDRVVRNSGTVRFRTMQEEWSGDVAAASATFAMSCVAADVVDLDLNRTPGVGTLLVARDEARRVTRPCWEAEDKHVATMKEYHPAVVEPHPKYSEMTAFLRSLRVHNWSIEVVKSSIGRKATAPNANNKNNSDDNNTKDKDKEQENRAREMETGLTGKEPKSLKRQRTEMTCAPPDDDTAMEEVGPNNDEDDDKNKKESDDASDEDDCGDDGWLYVALTEEAERHKRREYHRGVKQRSRTWEHDSANGGTEADKWGSDGSAGSE
ncbi:pseudouridylate synthase I [Trypanosoma grayi]|uniref:pseudouridylate synthase I n=1 Tax=Trypanosoma grayi TaxID=71804 RepID=UPI0004F4B45B|nr:pseudouridylate synthase I [Trypanosoma grayi]KEG12279.1 pseudouridylate synthase I [Trypanosoma grayi]